MLCTVCKPVASHVSPTVKCDVVLPLFQEATRAVTAGAAEHDLSGDDTDGLEDLLDDLDGDLQDDPHDGDDEDDEGEAA